MRTRKLTEEQILSIPKLKETMSWGEVAEKFQISTALAKYYGKALKLAGHKIKKQPSMKPLDLEIDK